MLVTGHTGFKGSWTSLWLESLGANVTGFALPAATDPSLFELARVADGIQSIEGDLRSIEDLQRAVDITRPQIVLHLAAQPLVRQSFADPVETYATNILGTVNLLQCLRGCETLEAVVVATTDKVYRNTESHRAFVETDELGGHDPYAASKAACELVTASFARSYFDPIGVPVATARGGNVIGGGDFSVDRIVPDVWRAISEGSTLTLRYPDATRPWQHALDCLAGYLIYAETLSGGGDCPRALNFGPGQMQPMSVAQLVEALHTALDSPLGWVSATEKQPHEMTSLAIDSRMARDTLGWADRLIGPAAVEWTAAWYRSFKSGADMRAFTLHQLEAYSAL